MSFLDDDLFLFDSADCGGPATAMMMDAAAFFDGFDLSTVDVAAPADDETVSVTSLFSDWTDSDSWDLTSDSSGSTAGSPPASESPHEPEKKRKKTQAPAAARPSEAVFPGATAATAAALPLKRPRKHNRLEILKLRDEVEVLETRLSTLQKGEQAPPSSAQPQQQIVCAAGSVTVSVAVAAQYALREKQKQQQAGNKGKESAYTVSFPRSVWLDVAVEQYTELQLAEAKNRRLRAAVDRHAALYASFESLVRSTGHAADMSDLLADPKMPCMRHGLLRPTLPGLFQSVTDQLPQTDALLEMMGLRNNVATVFHACQTKQHAVRGSTFELSTNTPVTGHYEHFARTLWDRITDCSAQQQIPLPTPLTRLKTVQITLENQDGRAEVSGLMAIRRFEQKDRVVIALAATYVAEGSAVVFREEGWVVTSALDAPVPDYLPSWARPSERTLMQTVYRMYAEKPDPLSATGSSPFTELPDQDTRFLQEFVIQAMGNKVREHTMDLQASLLSVSSVEGLRKMDFADCPLIDSQCC